MLIGSLGITDMASYFHIIIILVPIISLLAVVYFNDKANRIILFCIILSLVRVGFDLIILPIRAQEGHNAEYREETIRIGQRFLNDELYLYKNTRWQFINSFYLANTRQKITYRKPLILKGKYYITDLNQFPLDTTTVYIAIDSLNDAEYMQCRHIITRR